MTKEVSLSEYGKEKNLDDEQLCEIAKEKWGMDAEDVYLMLAIERDEVTSDVIAE